ncbi:CotH protein [Fibrobacter sp. UWT3]|uniref:CotH kinase family protein n=1 Tax=Fibrobacter sp. UWT3 TaxID=1896225 RepID=UPI000BD5E723|nr:CotH kinase family protein [Fibrobacter sp. UWT3]SOE78621.1 CotH protein [Fibrobacter sp. UWT3]
MSSLKKFSLAVGFGLAGAFAQTYDLPIVFIDTKGECLDNTVNDKMPATMSVLDAATNNVADSAKGTHYDIGIKVRGQSSAKFPKPGYSVEVRDNQGEGIDVSMLGLPPADDWVFHGPYVDKSMMRNALAHWLFRQAGHYSPRTKHFDLYINGVYRGVYVLIEKIKRGKYRVDVSKLKETDISGDDVTGGYIWAFDKTGTNTGGMGNEDINKEGFKTADGLNVIMHYPKKENLQQQQQAYLKKYLEDLENLFKNGKNGSGYENYVDMTSALDYVLHEEVTNNSDSYWCSFFLHKPKDSKGGKVTLGPAWDFNLAMSNGSQPENGGNNNGGNNGFNWNMWGGGGMGGGGMGSSGTTGWQIESTMKTGMSGLKIPNWLLGMWKDSHYQSELKKRWAELRSGVWHTKTMDVYLDSMKTYLTKAADRNFKRWPNLGQSSGQGDSDPQPMKYCNQGGGQQGMWGMNMPMGGYNADTWDGEFEHLRKKMKERMAWMDQQLGFTEPAQPIVTEPVIHVPDWAKDTVSKVEPPPVALDDFSRLSPTNFFNVNGDKIEIMTDLGGTFALVDLNGVTLFKTRIKKGVTTLKVPESAQDKHWIATLNGKMLSR